MEVNNSASDYLNVMQNSSDIFRTQTQAESLNSALKKNGKGAVKEMGKDEFLKLLITQLKHQDPTSPMDDKQFIAQMAQFSTLEQMLSFNSSMNKLVESVSFQSSFELLGKTVDIESPGLTGINGETRIVNGVIESVSKKNSEVYVRVNGEDYPAANITALYR